MLEKLGEKFAPEHIDWRPGATNSDKTSALALAYLTSRAVMDRLDEAVGPANWQDTYRAGPQGGVLCTLSVRVDGEWIAKEDGGENTDVEAVKGGLSEAFKRAAVKWGIGRYLYDLPPQWEPVEAYGKSVRFKHTPRLPQWALPAGAAQTGRNERDTAPTPSAPSRAPREATGAADDWVRLTTDLMRKEALTGADVRPVLGGFSKELMEKWLAEDSSRSVEEIVELALVGRN